MTLAMIVLVANLGLASAEAEAVPAPQSTPASAVQSSDVPATGEATAAIDAGLKAFRQHRLTQAEVQFRKAVEADPGSAAAHFYLGYTNYKMGEPARRMNEHKEKARAEFAKAFELDPAFRPVWGSSKK